ncbi:MULTISPECIES: pyridoxal phosphate-dependent decarboxylase family protein [unclassified Frankia]
MHRFDGQTADLVRAICDFARVRLGFDPVPLDAPLSRDELAAAVGSTITAEGIGGRRVLEVFDEKLSRACISTDHPRNLAFIPAAPTKAAVLFDLVVGASSIYAGSWMEGAGAVFAENEALRWLSDLAGFPACAGGLFVPGGTVGNLSALAAARHAARSRLTAAGRPIPPRWRFVCGAEAHSSLYQAATVLDAEVVVVPTDDAGRLTGPLLAEALDRLAEQGGAEAVDGVFAVVATAGTTQFGTVDDIRGVVDVCQARGLWVHVDGAYGLAALAAASTRSLFDGIAETDSFIVDPHKWLFAPFDACALVYRDPAVARAAHGPQRAGYLEVLDSAGAWNPSDYAIGLSRRARGLPFWFSLATHGTLAYGQAIESTLATARAAVLQIAALPHLELVREPQLSIVVFRRLGWQAADYRRWSENLLRDGFAFVPPTVHEGETVARFAIVNPRTTVDDIGAILATMA